MRLAALWMMVFAATPARAHRLDEYLQGTLLSVEKNRLQAEITLTPGVSVLPLVLADIDTDRNGTISETEERAYAARVLRDLSVTVDRRPLKLRLVSRKFPNIDAMKEGLGEIRIEFAADLPRGGSDRRLVLENHHESRIAAYQVNCLVPRDPDVRVLAQRRNYTQSVYELEYAQAGGGGWDDRVWLGALALGLIGRFGWKWRRRT